MGYLGIVDMRMLLAYSLGMLVCGAVTYPYSAFGAIVGVIAVFLFRARYV